MNDGYKEVIISVYHKTTYHPLGVKAFGMESQKNEKEVHYNLQVPLNSCQTGTRADRDCVAETRTHCRVGGSVATGSSTEWTSKPGGSFRVAFAAVVTP